LRIPPRSPARARLRRRNLLIRIRLLRRCIRDCLRRGSARYENPLPLHVLAATGPMLFIYQSFFSNPQSPR
jgi:hypothetical protein